MAKDLGMLIQHIMHLNEKQELVSSGPSFIHLRYKLILIVEQNLFCLRNTYSYQLWQNTCSSVYIISHYYKVTFSQAKWASLICGHSSREATKTNIQPKLSDPWMEPGSTSACLALVLYFGVFSNNFSYMQDTSAVLRVFFLKNWVPHL